MNGPEHTVESDAAPIVAVLAEHRMVQYTGQGSVLCACVDQHSIQWTLSEYRAHVASALVAAGIGVITAAPTRVLPPGKCACPSAEVENGTCVLCGKPFPVGGDV